MSQGDHPGEPGTGTPEDLTAKIPSAMYPAQNQPHQGHVPERGEPGLRPEPASSNPDQWVTPASAMSQTNHRVQSMPWQERMLRVPGYFAIAAGAAAILSCLFPWWALFDRSNGSLTEYSITPFRGISASSGSRWTDMAAINTLASDDLELAQTIAVFVGIALAVAALSLVVGGLLVARARMQVAGISLTLFGAVILGYARVPSEIVGNAANAATDFSSAVGSEFSLIAEMVGSMVPEARFGLGLSTVALTLAVLGLVVYIAMIAYRETIRIKRWMA